MVEDVALTTLASTSDILDSEFYIESCIRDVTHGCIGSRCGFEQRWQASTCYFRDGFVSHSPVLHYVNVSFYMKPAKGGLLAVVEFPRCCQ